ncbi:hypothetical protein KGF54_005314 [Candida jiufengensis]|uniref:uncharacterized protein n=1 Tax=Candida jiufengensis TaxID=497108 RepID=UPI0022249704|nr:uncharacterized protein KGF54_005314 [Candida jiufengensis]KAI5950166.1 hypothetical protein KGF54_005314 [Candida jiufengensis]
MSNQSTISKTQSEVTTSTNHQEIPQTQTDLSINFNQISTSADGEYASSKNSNTPYILHKIRDSTKKFLNISKISNKGTYTPNKELLESSSSKKQQRTRGKKSFSQLFSKKSRKTTTPPPKSCLKVKNNQNFDIEYAKCLQSDLVPVEDLLEEYRKKIIKIQANKKKYEEELFEKQLEQVRQHYYTIAGVPIPQPEAQSPEVTQVHENTISLSDVQSSLQTPDDSSNCTTERRFNSEILQNLENLFSLEDEFFKTFDDSAIDENKIPLEPKIANNTSITEDNSSSIKEDVNEDSKIPAELQEYYLANIKTTLKNKAKCAVKNSANKSKGGKDAKQPPINSGIKSSSENNSSSTNGNVNEDSKIPAELQEYYLSNINTTFISKIKRAVKNSANKSRGVKDAIPQPINSGIRSSSENNSSSINEDVNEDSKIPAELQEYYSSNISTIWKNKAKCAVKDSANKSRGVKDAKQPPIKSGIESSSEKATNSNDVDADSAPKELREFLSSKHSKHASFFKKLRGHY